MTQDSPNPLGRRDVLKVTAATLAGLSADAGRARAAAKESNGPPVMCLFSKPLQNRPVAELPGVTSGLGFSAVDLTCRPGGHVLPERAADDLPRAVERLRAGGIAVAMLTTAITDPDKDHAETIVATAAHLGVRRIKIGYYPYGEARVRDTLEEVRPRLRGVAELCRKHNVLAGLHNHAGHMVGAAMWDVWDLIRDLPADAIGSYFDLRHATTEGGLAGWRIGLDLLLDRVAMVAVKDFVWKRDEKRGWVSENVPLGEGMVPLDAALRRLKDAGFAGPISLHMEHADYAARPGSEGDRRNLDNIRHDRDVLHVALQRAGLA